MKVTVIMRAPRTDETKSAATVLQGGGLIVELVQHDEAVPLRNVLPAARGALYVHGIFKVGVTVDDFDATIAAIRARGISIVIGPFAKRPDQPANAVIQDNMGTYIQIFGKSASSPASSRRTSTSTPKSRAPRRSCPAGCPRTAAC